MNEPSNNRLPHARGRRARTVGLALPVGAATLRARLHVEPMRWRLADVVGPARELADALSAASVQDARRRGQDVPCRPGCCACCRYAVPLSPPEAFRLAEELALPPGAAGPVAERFASAEARLTAAGSELGTAANGAPPSPEAVGRWYRGLDLPCPLLAGDRCRQYTTRPIACRTYFATTPPALCAAPASRAGRRLPMPVSIVTALCRLAAEVEQREPEAVLLPMVPSWAAANAGRGRRTWPAVELTERFVRILHEGAESPAADAPAA